MGRSQQGNGKDGVTMADRKPRMPYVDTINYDYDGRPSTTRLNEDPLLVALKREHGELGRADIIDKETARHVVLRRGMPAAVATASETGGEVAEAGSTADDATSPPLGNKLTS